MADVDHTTVPDKITVDKLKPNDPRAKSQFIEVNGHKWHYYDAVPEGTSRGTIVLVHGFPDLAFGWRYQIPMLMSLGLRCIALDCMGYAGTGTSSDLKDFSMKSHANAIAAIAKKIEAPKIILGGHDWGGAVVYRVAQWHPDLVSHVISVATPYFSIHDQYFPAETIVKMLPQFGYQLQFGSDDQRVEKAVHTEEQIRKFLSGLYGGQPKSGKRFMSPEDGVVLSLIEDDVGMTPLLSKEELDFYVAEYMKNGLNGPCNWYRMRKINFDEELEMPAEQKKGVAQPTLFIQCLKDNVLTADLAKGMPESISNLTKKEVNASHWALWHTPQETNDIMRNWIESVVFGNKSKI